MITRIPWDLYFLGIAQAVAARGDCSRTQVGAVLVRPDHSIASTGYNGFPPGDTGCLAGGCPRGLLTHEELGRFEEGGIAANFDSGPGRCDGLHAEQNCFAFAREDTAGFTLYVTRCPCAGCSRAARAQRLSRVVYPTTDRFGVSEIRF